jgi:ribosomal protein L7/L12
MATKGAGKDKDAEVDYHVLVADVDKSRADSAAEAFSAAFGIEAVVAQQILKSAPIVFLGDASRGEIKAMTPRLIEVSKAGIEFRITSRSIQRIPKVNWPVRPQFAFGAGPADRGASATYDFEQNIFVCPCCGETYLFRRVGRPPLGEAERASARPAAEGRPVIETADLAPEAPSPELTPTSMPPVEETAEPAEPSPPPPRPAPPSRAASRPVPPPPPEPEPQEPAPEEPEPAENLLAEEAPAAEEQLLADDEYKIEAEQVEEEPPAMLPKSPPPPPARPAAAPKPPPARPAPAAAPPKAAPTPAEGEDVFNVFLSKITATDKKEQAAELISELKQCPLDEARELAGRLIIPLLKDVPKAEAEDALNRFKAIKVTGRMTISRKK